METFARDGLTFDVRDHHPDGPARGTAVLLHGFPQDGTAWDAVVPQLVAAGLRVLVPDQRGYSPGARPAGRRASATRQLVDDVVALLDAAGVTEAHVVGHDWGGVVAWSLGSHHPDRVASLTVLSTPHPVATFDGARRGTQAWRSLYMLAFQLPGLPERLLTADDGARARRALERTGLSPARARYYADRMLEPGALTAALAWYRALPWAREYPTGRVRVPTAYLYGTRDPFFAPASVRATARYVLGPYVETGFDEDHWLPEHRPDDVAAAVLRHVAEQDDVDAG